MLRTVETGVTRDPGERRPATESLVAAAFDALPAQVAVVDADGVILQTNRAWETFGLDNDLQGDTDMVGENYLSVCDAGDEDAQTAAAGIRAVLASEREAFELEYPCHSPDERRWFLMRAIALPDCESGAALVMHVDITDRKEVELRVEANNETLSTVTGVLSHDLRNPLSVATGSLELYHETGEEAHYERVKHAHERIDSIIEDVLTLTRQGERVDDPEPVSLEEVASAAWRTVQTDDATLYVGGDATVEADPSRLQQLLENLFRNAIEHGPAGVCVHVGVTDDGFFVADDGRGIDPENRDAVFRPGYSTNEDGTGLGLSIVGEIAEAHGWSAAVAGHGDARSDDDGGACRAGAKIEISNVRFVGD